MRYQANLYALEENRPLKPAVLASMVSSALYEKRFGPYFIEPVVAGLDVTNGHAPYICTMDLIGCLSTADDFVVSGTCSSNLFGMCEALYVPNLEPEKLFETISQALMNAVDRDALSGWGAVVTLITPQQVVTRELRARMD
jgi:20S proteasome subunit beta 3